MFRVMLLCLDSIKTKGLRDLLFCERVVALALFGNIVSLPPLYFSSKNTFSKSNGTPNRIE